MKHQLKSWIAAGSAALVIVGATLLVAPATQAQSVAQPQAEQVEFGQKSEELVWNSLPSTGDVVAADAAPAPQWSGSARWNRKSSVVSFWVHTRNFPSNVTADFRGYVNGKLVYSGSAVLSGTQESGVELYREVHPEVSFGSVLTLEIDVFGMTTSHTYVTPEEAPTFGWTWFAPGDCSQQVATFQGQGILDPHDEVFYGPSSNGPWTFVQSFELPNDNWQTGIMTVTDQYPAMFFVLQKFYGGDSQAHPRGEKVDGPFNRPDCSQTATPTPTPVITETPTATPTETPTPVWTPSVTPSVTPPANTPTVTPEPRCDSLTVTQTGKNEFQAILSGTYATVGIISWGDDYQEVVWLGTPVTHTFGVGTFNVVGEVLSSNGSRFSSESCNKTVTVVKPVPGTVYIPALCRDCAPDWEWLVCGMFFDPAKYCFTQRYNASVVPHLIPHPDYWDSSVVHQAWGIGWQSFFNAQVFIAHIGAGPSEIVTAVLPQKSGTQTADGGYVFNEWETISQSPVIQALHVQTWIQVKIDAEPTVDSANLAYDLK